MDASQTKAAWEGEAVSVQPRSTAWRYLLDNRMHREVGYSVFARDGARGCLRSHAGSEYNCLVIIFEVRYAAGIDSGMIPMQG